MMERTKHASLAERMAGASGRGVLRLADHLGGICALILRLITQATKRPVEGRALVWKVIIEQIYFTAIQALWLIIPIALIIGTALIAQFTMLSGQYDPGKLMVVLVVRELSPLITALIVGTFIARQPNGGISGSE